MDATRDGPEVAVPPVKATATKNLIELFDSDSSEEPFEDGDAAEASDAADPIQDVLGAVYEASGYVVLDHVVSEPEDKEWFQDCIQDLFTLFKTNNCVRIWNNGGRGSKAKDDKKRHMLMFSKFKCQDKFKGANAAPPSDPVTLARVEKFFAPMFGKMLAKLRALHLIQSPRMAGEAKILISQKGCAAQRMHYDFDPAAVSKLRESNQLIGVPISALCSFTPGGSSLLIREAPDKPVRTVRLHFGSMCIFTGDVLHAGSAYKSLNIRGFYHVVHESLCPYDPDLLFVSTRKSKTAPPPATAPPVTTPPPATAPAPPPTSDHTAEAASATTTSHGKQLGTVVRRRSVREQNAPLRLIENKTP